MNDTKSASAPAKVMPLGDDSDLPHIIIVGGGAGGLELATRLGDKLGKKGKRQDLAGGEGAHAHLEAAPARDRRRQHGRRPPRARLPGAGLLARLPVPLRRDDRHRPQAAARVPRRHLRRGGPRDHAHALLQVRHARHRHRLRRQRLRHARRQGARHHARHARGGRALQPPPHQRLRARLRARGAHTPRATARGDHRRRRHRHRARRRAASAPRAASSPSASTRSIRRRTSRSR